MMTWRIMITNKNRCSLSEQIPLLICFWLCLDVFMEPQGCPCLWEQRERTLLVFGEGEGNNIESCLFYSVKILRLLLDSTVQSSTKTTLQRMTMKAIWNNISKSQCVFFGLHYTVSYTLRVKIQAVYGTDRKRSNIKAEKHWTRSSLPPSHQTLYICYSVHLIDFSLPVVWLACGVSAGVLSFRYEQKNQQAHPSFSIHWRTLPVASSSICV